MAVGCYECHQANRGDADVFIHSKPETYISVIVSPKDCSRCHMQAVRQFAQSAHFTAADDVLKLPVGKLVGGYVFGDNVLKPAPYPETATAAAVNGCWKCHGCKVKLDKSGKQVKLDPSTWPNMGVGRINPDGSKGSCSACHSGHEFSAARARRPESCKECHSGGASLYEYQIYMQSKHGINYAANSIAPTCATCHMSAGKDIPATHNVNLRIDLENHTFTDRMKATCTPCHTSGVVNNLAVQAEAEAALVKTKWAGPAAGLYCQAVTLLKKMKGEKYYPFTYPIDYTALSISQYIKVARLAAFMMSPQFVEDNNKALAAAWFGTFVPQLRELVKQGETFPESQKLAKTLSDTLKQPVYGPGWPKTDISGCPQKGDIRQEKGTGKKRYQ
jgi:hypothetical protein